jgi:integrase
VGVYRRKIKKGIRWYYSGQYLGQKYHSRAIYLLRAEAMKAERKYITALDEEIRNPQNDMALMELMNSKLDELKLKKSKTYYKENRRYFKMFYDYVGDVKVSDVTKPQINNFLADFSKDLLFRGKTNYKVNSCLAILKTLFFHGIRVYDLNIKNPCVGLEFYPFEKKLKYIPTERDIEAVLELCDPEERKLVEFVRDTGARIDEAMRLMPEDVIDDCVVLYTRKSRYSNLMPRKVPRPECLKNFKGEGRVFNRWDRHPRFLEKMILQLNQKRWNWHNLRHRYASKLSKERRPIFEIMALLGHSQITTTQNYLQVLP